MFQLYYWSVAPILFPYEKKVADKFPFQVVCGFYKWLPCSTTREFRSVLDSFLLNLIWESLECFSVEEFRETVLYNSLLTTEFLCRLSEFSSSL